jgi:CubicO group peptidase (beta-lactamase class C family)
VTSEVQAIIDGLIAGDLGPGRTLAVMVRRGGSTIAEGYGVRPDTPFGPGGPVDAGTALTSWSMAKSITHAVVGLLVGEGRLELDAPAPVPDWAGTTKSAITLQHLLEMRPGLRFVEDYVDGSVSHCIDMLFGSGADDHAAYAASLPLDHEPGTIWNYASGTTNIVSRIIGDVITNGSNDPTERARAVAGFLEERLFTPLGMASARTHFDAAGNWVASSYVDATALDFARFGELYLHDGVHDGRRLLPVGWVDHARTQVAVDEESGFGYGAHWWLWPELPGSLAAHGYEGQYTLIVPSLGLVVVHLGKWDAADRPLLVAALRRIVSAVGAGE